MQLGWEAESLARVADGERTVVIWGLQATGDTEDEELEKSDVASSQVQHAVSESESAEGQRVGWESKEGVGEGKRGS